MQGWFYPTCIMLSILFRLYPNKYQSMYWKSEKLTIVNLPDKVEIPEITLLALLTQQYQMRQMSANSPISLNFVIRWKMSFFSIIFKFVLLTGQSKSSFSILLQACLQVLFIVSVDYEQNGTGLLKPSSGVKYDQSRFSRLII